MNDNSFQWLVIVVFATLVAVLCCQSVALAATNSDLAPSSTTSVYRDQKQINATRGLVKRSGGRLDLTLADGKTLSLIDGDGCPEENVSQCWEHIFDYHSRKLAGYLVYKGYYEGFEVLWINQRTGKITAFREEPHFSPSGNWAVLAKASPYNEYFNGVEIWKRESGDYSLQWTYESLNDKHYYGFGKWLDEDRVELIRFVEDGGYTGLYRPVGTARLLRLPNWHIE